MQDNQPSDSAARAAADNLFPKLCRAVVVHEDEVRVTVMHNSRSSTVAVTPRGAEGGNLIGKNGRQVKSFRLLAKLVSERHGWPVNYAVDVGVGENPPAADRQEPEGNWNSAAAAALLLETMESFCHKRVVVSYQDVGQHTAFEVVLHEREPEMTCSIPVMDGFVAFVKRGDEAVAAAVNTVFKAMGKVRGHTVHVELVRRQPLATAPPQERQPATAAGRYAGETA